MWMNERYAEDPFLVSIQNTIHGRFFLEVESPFKIDDIPAEQYDQDFEMSTIS